MTTKLSQRENEAGPWVCACGVRILHTDNFHLCGETLLVYDVEKANAELNRDIRRELDNPYWTLTRRIIEHGAELFTDKLVELDRHDLIALACEMNVWFDAKHVPKTEQYIKNALSLLRWFITSGNHDIGVLLGRNLIASEAKLIGEKLLARFKHPASETVGNDQVAAAGACSLEGGGAAGALQPSCTSRVAPERHSPERDGGSKPPGGNLDFVTALNEDSELQKVIAKIAYGID